MVDLSSDKLLSLNEAAKLLGRRVSMSTWWRWGKRGVRGHRLNLTRVGGRVLVSVQALQTFISATNAKPGEPVPTRTNRQREAAIRQAERECEAAGI
jgi:hypothetical protein